MSSSSILRRFFVTSLLSTLLFSCQASVPKATQKTKATTPNTNQTIIYGDLVINQQSDYILIPVSLSGDKQNRDNLLRSSSYSDRGMSYSNIIFYRKKDGQSHLLLNKKAIISSYEFLEKKEKGKPAARFWLYRIIENDTNGDKQLTYEDASIGYLSDLSGKNLRQITPNNTQLVNWSLVQSIGAIFVKVIKDSDNDKKFTERDEVTFIRVNLAKPSIGTEIISDKIKQDLKSIEQK